MNTLKYKMREDRTSPRSRRKKKVVSLSKKVKQLRVSVGEVADVPHETTEWRVQQEGAHYENVVLRKAVEGSVPAALRHYDGGAPKVGFDSLGLLTQGEKTSYQILMEGQESATEQVRYTNRRRAPWVLIHLREGVSGPDFVTLAAKAKPTTEQIFGATKPVLVYETTFQSEAIKAQQAQLGRSHHDLLEFTKAAKERLEQLFGVSVKLARDRVKPAVMPLDSPESRRIVKSAAKRVISEHADVIRALADR